MGRFLVITIGLLLLLWGILVYGYSAFVLADSIVPVEGMEIEEWLSGYRLAGGASGVLGFACASIWYYLGDNYLGGSGIEIKYFALLIASLLAGALTAFFVLPPSIDGSGLSFAIVMLLPPLLYYLASLCASAEPVKFIPPLGSVMHK